MELVGADAFNCSTTDFNKKWLANIKLNNIPVNIYTVNDAKNMKRFLKMGVSGIFTNNPDILKRVVADVKLKTRKRRRKTMNISNSLINIIEAALDTLIKASGMDLRLHGLENVPDQPVFYVINHFTRIETILMPYIIKKNIKKYPVSLADKSFFSGKMGDIYG